MHPHTRVMVAACAHAIITVKTVTGIYDHAAGEHLQIAAQCRGNRVQGADGERSAKFGGTLPEIYDEGDKTFVSLAVEGTTARGFDRGTSGFYTANVNDPIVQLYDHGQNAWFAFDV